MSLTTAEETKVKNLIKKTDYEKQIATIDKTAFDAMQVKADESKAIDEKRLTDRKAKQDLINALG